MAHDKFVWMDLEMTGLDPVKDQIIEIASLITDQHLNIIATGPNLVIHCPLQRLEQMDDWNTKHHQASGLWQSCLDSSISLADATATTLEFIRQHTQSKQSPLCGNSIWQDRRFLAQHMPKIDEHLHYRLIDVSTLKELSKRWYPNYKPFEKKNGHRALDDIHESLAELRYYRHNVFNSSST